MNDVTISKNRLTVLWVAIIALLILVIFLCFRKPPSQPANLINFLNSLNKETIVATIDRNAKLTLFYDFNPVKSCGASFSECGLKDKRVELLKLDSLAVLAVRDGAVTTIVISAGQQLYKLCYGPGGHPIPCP